MICMDLEKNQGTAFQGLNTRDSNAQIALQLDIQGNANIYQVDSFLHHDAIAIIRDGEVRVEK